MMNPSHWAFDEDSAGDAVSFDQSKIIYNRTLQAQFAHPRRDRTSAFSSISSALAMNEYLGERRSLVCDGRLQMHPLTTMVRRFGRLAPQCPQKALPIETSVPGVF